MVGHHLYGDVVRPHRGADEYHRRWRFRPGQREGRADAVATRGTRWTRASDSHSDSTAATAAARGIASTGTAEVVASKVPKPPRRGGFFISGFRIEADSCFAR